MDFEHAIRDAKRRSSKGKFRYPAYATLLAKAGVTSYTVNVATRQTDFLGKKGEKHSETGGTQRSIAAAYDSGALGTAIRLSQSGEIQYPEFMDKLAAAGVTKYEARVGDRVVVYQGHGKSFKKAIPR